MARPIKEIRAVVSSPIDVESINIHVSFPDKKFGIRVYPSGRIQKIKSWVESSDIDY